MVVKGRVLVCEIGVPEPGFIVRFLLVFLLFLEVVVEDFENTVRDAERFWTRFEDVVHQKVTM